MSQSQKQAKKILRIGIIQSGKIIEERLLRQREPVTIGQSTKNTFTVPGSQLPPRFPIFELRGDAYHLTFADWMDGRVSVATGVSDFGTLKQQGLARRTGVLEHKDEKGTRKKVPVYQVPLTEKSRGKIVLGDVTLLFQFVVPPPVPAKPQLPAIIRGGWVRGVDWIYTGILLVSFVAHSGFIYLFQVTPIPEVTTLDMIENRFAEMIYVKRPPPKKKDDGAGATAGAGAAKKNPNPKKRPPKKVAGKGKTKGARGRVGPKRAPTAEEIARARARRREAIRRRLARVGMVALVGAKGTGDSGTVVTDVLAGGGHLERDMDRSLEGLQGVKVASGGAGSLARGSRRTGGAAGGRRLSIKESLTAGDGGGGGGKLSGAKTKRRRATKLHGKISISAAQLDEGELDQKAMYRLLRRKKSAVTLCYERELRRSPNLRGRISVRITIATSGRVTNIAVEDNTLNASVFSCIRRRIKYWRFPKPKDGAATVVVPFIFAPSR